MALPVNDNLITYSAEVLANTEYGMTWAQIVKFFRKKSAEYKVAVPYRNTLFPSQLPNRRTGFIENLKVFSREQQVMLLEELCNSNKKINVTPLKQMLMWYSNDYAKNSRDGKGSTSKRFFLMTIVCFSIAHFSYCQNFDMTASIERERLFMKQSVCPVTWRKVKP